jgi:signal transduction histidine kinase/CheY-like chemotaxis protein
MIRRRGQTVVFEDVSGIVNKTAQEKAGASASNRGSDGGGKIVDDVQGIPFENSTASSSQLNLFSRNKALVFLFLILLVGVFASSLFLVLGVRSAKEEVEDNFVRQASDVIQQTEQVWEDYQTLAMWMHQACYERQITRPKFREIQTYMNATGLEFQAVCCAHNISSPAERAAAEAEASAYYSENHPDMVYEGITGLEPDPETGLFSPRYRSQQPFYFPVRFIEPLEGNEAAVDFDLYSAEGRARTIDAAISTGKPVLTPRLRLVQESDPSAYGVILMHPGIPVSPEFKWPFDLATVVIRIPSLLSRAIRFESQSIAVYLFDSTAKNSDPEFMGGAAVNMIENKPSVSFLAETSLADQRKRGRTYEDTIEMVSNQWTMIVIPLDGMYEENYTFVIIGTLMIFLSCALIGIFVCASIRRVAHMSKVKSETEAEKAALLVDNAKQSAKAERELNDFIAHEVRNPLSAAMSALSFVSMEVDTEPPLASEEARQSVQEDLDIIKGSLHFINDLLRSMLDVHRAASNQLVIAMAPTDIKKDVFEPVAAMIYNRRENFEVLIDCADGFTILADRLRLTQVILNLARNSAKFVTTGYVRLRAEVVGEGNVVISVEDSGPGIPSEKRGIIFSKFQESLDSLNQGTGIGLCLCKHLTELMKGDLALDETFDSGIPHCPGTRFEVNLRTSIVDLDSNSLDLYEKTSREGSRLLTNSLRTATTSTKSQSMSNFVPHNEAVATSIHQLPQTISVLFVDDNLVLRKLFSRAIKRVEPGWIVQDAASGEAALTMVESDTFDLIFVDQYMASMEKQLLGTETVAALRSKGVKSRICGLSANDVEVQFVTAGADFFLLKPISSDKDILTADLHHILYGARQWKGEAGSSNGDSDIGTASTKTPGSVLGSDDMV